MTVRRGFLPTRQSIGRTDQDGVEVVRVVAGTAASIIRIIIAFSSPVVVLAHIIEAPRRKIQYCTVQYSSAKATKVWFGCRCPRRTRSPILSCEEDGGDAVLVSVLWSDWFPFLVPPPPRGTENVLTLLAHHFIRSRSYDHNHQRLCPIHTAHDGGCISDIY